MLLNDNSVIIATVQSPRCRSIILSHLVSAAVPSKGSWLTGLLSGQCLWLGVRSITLPGMLWLYHHLLWRFSLRFIYVTKWRRFVGNFWQLICLPFLQCWLGDKRGCKNNLAAAFRNNFFLEDPWEPILIWSDLKNRLITKAENSICAAHLGIPLNSYGDVTQCILHADHIFRYILSDLFLFNRFASQWLSLLVSGWSEILWQTGSSSLHSAITVGSIEGIWVPGGQVIIL